MIPANVSCNVVHPFVVDKDDKELMVGARISAPNARQILIATTWRSGSTFLGQLLNHYPGTFYSFEPLMSTDGEERQELHLLDSLFKCR